MEQLARELFVPVHARVEQEDGQPQLGERRRHRAARGPTSGYHHLGVLHVASARSPDTMSAIDDLAIDARYRTQRRQA
ncbi:hypothetical protein KH5H1_54300 [Corallococcus caeni]|uniref:Uncharacterized protein n=1 Tax=Corallococcus caeni TaxID=3082388 RepID=A0ABQ6QIA4_9BACT|nr:hypothetical protein KH5H1_54300 [Corallococcus sp. KH5-1]GMU03818.1 hypothetical protein ASNO1_00700 [Corallococcus sp. NO1]